MALRLSDMPEHIRLAYEKQLAAEASMAPMRQWHIEVTLGVEPNVKVMKSKPSTDEAYVQREYAQYVRKFGSSKAKIVKSLTEVKKK